MSFESARPINLDSFTQSFNFRRPQVRYPIDGVRQSVNISADTLKRATEPRQKIKAKVPHASLHIYNRQGAFSQNQVVGQALQAFA